MIFKVCHGRKVHTYLREKSARIVYGPPLWWPHKDAIIILKSLLKRESKTAKIFVMLIAFILCKSLCLKFRRWGGGVNGGLVRGLHQRG